MFLDPSFKALRVRCKAKTGRYSRGTFLRSQFAPDGPQRDREGLGTASFKPTLRKRAMMDAVYAQAAPSAFDALNSLIVPTVLIIGIMYFLMIRPQQKRLKEHQAMIAAIRRGDTVVTSGGILGKVTKVDDQELQVEIAEGVRVKVVRGTVSEVRGKGEVAPAAPKSKAAAEGDS